MHKRYVSQACGRPDLAGLQRGVVRQPPQPQPAAHSLFHALQVGILAIPLLHRLNHCGSLVLQRRWRTLGRTLLWSLIVCTFMDPTDVMHWHTICSEKTKSLHQISCMHLARD